MHRRTPALNRTARQSGGVSHGRLHTSRWPSLLAFVSCLGLFLVLSTASAAEVPKKTEEAKDPPRDDIFAGTNVLRLRLLIPNSGISALRNSGWGRGETRPKVKAIVREGTTLYTNVEVHLKGSAGSFRSVDDNPCFTLNFEKYAPGQTFHGYHKISLNNSVQDPSYLTEKVCRELFEAAGVPAPHAGFAKVDLNGKDLGLRVMVEGWGKHFLKRYFKNTKGNLYDGGFVEDITDTLQVNSGDNPQEHPGLQALISATTEQDPTQRFSRFQGVLDMDRFLSFVAMDVMQCDWDGYAMNRNNWRLFHDMGANKMVFFPHGLDQMFGVERTSPDCSILPRMRGRVAVAVLSTPEGKSQYLQRMQELYTNVWHVDAILKRVDQLAAVLRPAIAETSSSAARYHDGEVDALKERISRRDESLRRQLGRLSNRGSSVLTGWSHRTQTGSPEFRQEKSAEGQDVLYLGVKGDSICSWRTRVTLEEGAYRFEGKIRTHDVRPTSGEPGAGAGLRISGGGVAAELNGTQDWQQFAYSFHVPEGGGDIEMVCELRASRGEAWFDSSSLRVVRLR